MIVVVFGALRVKITHDKLTSNTIFSDFLKLRLTSIILHLLVFVYTLSL